MDTAHLGLGMAFSAGLFSFLSPCVLPLIPSYLGTITGLTFDELTKAEDQARIRRLTLIHSLLFISGFSVVFVLLGATATAFGKALYQHQGVFRIVGGAIVVVLGLHFSGLLNIRFLQQDKRIHLKNRPLGYAGSFLIGLTFAFGWTPCIGPILGSILMVAATEQSILKGVVLLSVFSLGFGIPFLIASVAINRFLATYRRFNRHISTIITACGVFLIVIGLLLMTNNFSTVSMFLNGLLSR